MKQKPSLAEISKQVLKNLKEEVAFLSEMVKQGSVNDTASGSDQAHPEEGVARIIKHKLLDLGLRPKYVRARKHRPNVLVVWGPIRARRSLALVGNMDTAKPLWGNEQVWSSGHVNEGKLYGAGALDMKGGLATYVFALKALIDAGVDPAGQLKLAFTVDGKKDRNSNLGLRFLVKKGFKATAALLAKPGLDKIAIGHRGGYRFKIVTRGMSVNTGRRVWEEGKKGKNAILDMNKVIKKLSNFDLPFRPAKAFPGRVPVFTFPTKISGGKSVDFVPDYCEAWGDVRLLPGNTDLQVKMWMEERLSGLTDVDWELVDLLYAPAMEIERSNKFVQILYDQAGVILTKKPRVEGCGPWNEAWMLTCLSDTPCVAGFGPEGQDGTDPNEQEWVDIESLRKATEVLARTIYLYLGDVRSRKERVIEPTIPN